MLQLLSVINEKDQFIFLGDWNGGCLFEADGNTRLIRGVGDVSEDWPVDWRMILNLFWDSIYESVL